jgi:hypothetical protein
MKYTVEYALENFPAWSGGKDTLEVLIEKGVCEQLEQILDEYFADREEPPTETEVNDILWFERDWIAEMLGYDDWDAFEYAEESYNDINGVKLEVSDEVHWHDEAGYDEDGSMIVFTIVEDNGDGYFNLANEDEENPERWAYYTELEIV